MERIQNQTFDAERALYGVQDVQVQNCRFDGPADGESSLKECARVQADACFFNLRYPFWHDDGLTIRRSEMTEQCRAALWYSRNITVEDTKLHGIKALRECSEARLHRCSIRSPEFGWNTQGLELVDCTAEGEYFLMRAGHIYARDLSLTGKYSFQYIENAVFEHCTFDTKDAFWHAKHVLVRNSIIKGEYLAWYCEDVTFENCTIIGTQPLCYCKGLRLVNCRMEGCDLAFERSEVDAELTAPVLSIKNPLAGTIRVPAAGQVIRDIPGAQGQVVFTGTADAPRSACACA